MEEVLQGVRGMRQSMLDMHRTRAQASFARVVGSALRGLSAAVDDTLEATSRRSALLPASILACCHKVRGTRLYTILLLYQEVGNIMQIISFSGRALCCFVFVSLANNDTVLTPSPPKPVSYITSSADLSSHAILH